MSTEKPDTPSQGQEYEILKDPEQRLEMRKRALEVVEDIYRGKYSNLVFLDKSARPIQTLLRTVWDQQYPEVSFPHVNFINIGREKHGKFLLNPEEIKRIREQYSYLSNAPDGAKVLVVDEYSATGSSLKLAKKILDEVFSIGNDPTTPRLSVDTLAFAKAEGALFKSKQETYIAPWSFGNTSPNYGMSGVVDPSSESLTAEASRKMTTEMRMQILNDEQDRYREKLKQAAQSIFENDSLKKIIDGYAKSHSLESTDEDRYKHIQELLAVIAERYPNIAEQLRTLFATFFEEKILPCIIEGEAAARKLQSELADGDADSLGTRISDASLNKLLEVHDRRNAARYDFSRGGSTCNDLIRELLIWDEDRNDYEDDSFYKLGNEVRREFSLLLNMSEFREVMEVFATIQSSKQAIERLEKKKEEIVTMGESGHQRMLKKLREEIKAVASESVSNPKPEEQN